jgi:phosphoserine aminotransferase
MSRVYNFSAGPAVLPESVLEQAQAEMLNCRDSGMSPMEMSHRGEEFMAIAAEAESDLRELLNIPTHYKVLFLQGGASTQFASVPLNLLRGKKQADYLQAGFWGKKAISEAKKFCEVNVVANSESQNYVTVPPKTSWQCNADAAYFHYTPNETIGGLEMVEIPDVGNVPIVADMSSTILSRPIDVSRFGLIYAGAQKNIGPAGLTVVIVREDLIGTPLPNTPTMLDYQILAKENSMLNTPPTYAWYIAGLVFKWLKARGGLMAMAERNQRKAIKLYTAIDNSHFYSNPIDPHYRSLMNVPFILANENLNATFLAEAKESGLVALAGHRSVGGMRASIYNAMPEEGVQALIDFMNDFEGRA